MRTNKVTSDRRRSERRIETTERRSGTMRTGEHKNVAERREGESRGMVASMVDALEDILKYERASERVLRAAGSN